MIGRNFRGLIVLFIVFLALIPGIQLLAQPEGGFNINLPIVVKSSTCSVPSAGYATIQSAVDDGCEIINLTAALYIENIVILGHSVTIRGQGPSNTTINGNASGPVIVVENDSELTLEDVTITNGISMLMGGGIRNRGVATISNTIVEGNTTNNGPGGGIASDGTLTVLTSWIRNNTAEVGGGIYVGDSSLSFISGTVFSGNNASYGGGGIGGEGNISDAMVTLVDSELFDNEALYGGGILLFDGETMTISNTLIRNNTALDGGGGVYNWGAMQIIDSRIVENVAGIAGGTFRCGGGIMNSGGNGGVLLIEGTAINDNSSGQFGGGVCNHGSAAVVDVYDSLIAGNSTTIEGGGYYSYSNYVTLFENTTFYDNDSGTRGGAIWANRFSLVNVTMSENDAPEGGNIFVGGNATIINSIVAGNLLGDDCWIEPFGDLNSLGNNIDSDNSCDLNGAGDMPNTNPLLGPLQNNGGPTETRALQAGSPAINTADNAACPPTDQRGVIRPQGPACDIGAYEFDG